MKRLKGYFITGLLVLVPLYITLYVFSLIVGFMEGIFDILPTALRPGTYLPVYVPGMGVAFTVALVLFVGLVTQNFLGKRLLSLSERLLARIPVLRIVYNGTKQFMETFFSKDSKGFRKVVLVEFPRKGVYSIGFVTGASGGGLKDKTEAGAVSVFLPTAPNPTSGFFIVAPEEEVMYLDMKVEDAFKVIMTGGIVVPDGGKFMDTVLHKTHQM